MSEARRDAARDQRALWVFAAISYVPLLLTARGKVAADTKAYLYLDPGRLLSRAAWLWEPDVALGTITHQNIGYLFPLGPYFWIMQKVGIPDWIAQRLLLGTILLLAGWGVVWLIRQLNVTGAAPLVAGLVYLLSPYVLPYLGRTSALLLPWAALPWLVGLTARSLRLGGWRSPALFAIVLTVVGGTNASSLVFIGIGPAMWVPFAIWQFDETTLPDAARAVGRLAVLTIPTQLWWIAGLRLQGAYGLPILELTESVDTVAQTSTASEVARQLGYWYFYGRDGVSQWTYAARYHTQQLWSLVLGFVLPGLAMLAAVSTRWRYLTYFVGLVVVGLLLGVGTHPYDDPPPFGAAIKAATQESASALALRNTPRAVPLLALGFAVLLAAGLSALSTYTRTRWRGRRTLLGVVAMLAVAGVAVANAPALWSGKILSPDLLYDEELPDYWTAAAGWLDSRDDGTRILELPGSDFGAYRWGETQDPVLPGLVDRGWVGRELTAFGTPPSTDLVRALDRRIQEGVFEPQTLAPIARLMGVGDVLLRFDSQYERYRGPRPRQLWDAVAGGVPGLGEPVGFGTPVANLPDDDAPLFDELSLAGLALDDPPPLVAYPVADALPVVRAASGEPVVVDGDGEGLVDMAAMGLLDPARPLFYAAGVDEDQLVELLDDHGPLVITDTNRKRAQRWGTIRENNGYTEQAGESALTEDPEDTRLDVFPDAPDGAETVTELRGGIASVRASAYGNSVAYASERRPVLAIDGDQRTSWQVGGFSDVIGERLQIVLDQPVATDHISVQQLPGGNRFIATLGVVLDGEHVVSEVLDDRSRSAPGQEIVFGDRTFSTIELVIDHSNIEGPIAFNQFSNVGLVEVGVDDIVATEYVRPPTVLLETAGATLTDHPVHVVLSRLRADPAEPFRDDPETVIRRIIDVPAAQTWDLSGVVRLERRSAGEVIDDALERPGTDNGFAEASGSDFLPGDISARPSSAIDGDTRTAWQPGFGDQLGRGFEIRVAEQTTADRLDLVLLADDVHSVPTQLTLTPDAEPPVIVDLPPVEAATDDGLVTMSVPITPTSFTRLDVTVTGVDERFTEEYFTGEPLAIPVGIAELGLAGVEAAPVPAALDTVCRTDLVEVDGRPVPVSLGGANADDSYTLLPCGSLELAPGEHTVTTHDALDLGLAVDRLVLSYTPDGYTPVTPATAPMIDVDRPHRLDYTISGAGITEPFWLVVGQSLSDGWEAQLGGSGLGEPTLIAGYANGWLIRPGADGTVDIEVQWTPQRIIWFALAISAVALVVASAIAATPRRIVPRSHDVGQARLRTPFAGDPRPLPIERSVALAALLGAASGMVGGLVPGVVVGVTAALAAVAPRSRWILSVWPWAAFGVTAGWYVARQARFDYPMGVEWPAAFSPAHEWILTAVLMLGADMVVGEVRARSR